MYIHVHVLHVYMCTFYMVQKDNCITHQMYMYTCIHVHCNNIIMMMYTQSCTCMYMSCTCSSSSALSACNLLLKLTNAMGCKHVL